MAAVPGSLVPLSMPSMVAAAAAAMGAGPHLQPQPMMINGAAAGTGSMVNPALLPHSLSTAVGLPSYKGPSLTTSTAVPTFVTTSSGGGTGSNSGNSENTKIMNGDGLRASSPSRSQSSSSPPASNPQGGTPNGLVPSSGFGEDEKSTSDFLKELQTEKDSLESITDESILKTHTLKLLEQGKA